MTALTPPSLHSKYLYLSIQQTVVFFVIERIVGMGSKNSKQKTDKKKSGKSSVPDDGWKQLDILEAFAHQKPQNIMAIFPSEILKDAILSYLSINDLTNLSRTSREMFEKVSSAREYPCVVWEKRLPTRMRYDATLGDDDLTTVVQVQPFQFMVRTVSKETICILIQLLNAAWDEKFNMRDGDGCRELEQFPSSTYFTLSFQRK